MHKISILGAALFLMSVVPPIANRPLVHARTVGCRADTVRYDVALPGHPYAVAVSADGRSAFVSIVSSNPKSASGIATLRCNGGRYEFTNLVPLETQPTGLAITHDNRLLVVADDGFVTFVDPAAALTGRPAIVGYLQDLEGDPEDNDPGSAYVNVSPDDRFAFVSDEQNNTITVIDLVKARSTGFTRKAIVGTIPVANAPIALTFSRDSRYLFTTSEIGLRSYGWAKACRQEGAPTTEKPSNPPGVIITVDVIKAQVDPANSVIAKTSSDCSPVRMSLSPDGLTAWVTNRASDTLIAFSTKRLIAGDSDARIATIAVGSNPVAVAASNDGKYVLVANSNRFGAGGTTSGTVSIIAVAQRAVVGTIVVGRFPREFSRGLGSTLFLANYRSNSLTIFDESRLNELVTNKTQLR